MNIIEALNWRYAVNKFSDQIIDENLLQELLTATLLSPSSYGLQPYRLIVVKSLEIRQRLLKYSMNQDKVVNCSHLVIIAVQTDIGDATVVPFAQNYANIRGVTLRSLDKMVDHFQEALRKMTSRQKQEWAHQQAYIALGNLLTCAAMMKIDSCPMTGIVARGYDEELGLAEKGLATSVICPIGQRHVDDQNANKAKIRFSYDEMVRAI